MASAAGGESFADVPSISIARFRHGTAEERATEVQRVRRAFEHQGMALLCDHGVPRAAIDACVERSREFFALPRARKEEFLPPSDQHSRSYGAVSFPRGKAYAVQQEARGQIINEWLLVRDAAQPYDASSEYYTSPEGREFYSPEERYPEQQVWPEEVPGLREATSAYYRHVEDLANTMYEVFALALGLEPTYFLSRARNGPIWPVTIAHYPRQDECPPEGTMRIQPHWDRTLFSLITTNDVEEQARGGGLQILVDESGRAADGVSMTGAVWRNVPIQPDCFVLNVGEQMGRWTNGRFRHVVHRVPNPSVPSDRGRISVMAYVLPDYDTPVECLPCCLGDEPPKYEATWVGEMMNWGSRLPIYDTAKQERMRLAQGLYTEEGEQTSLGTPTDVNSVKLQSSL